MIFICRTFKFHNCHYTNLGARLFEPRSKAVNKLVFDKSKEVFGCIHITWIGINDRNTEGQWVFASNGAKVTSPFWHLGEPNSYRRTNEDCATIGHSRNEEWHDYPCSSMKFFICEMI